MLRIAGLAGLSLLIGCESADTIEVAAGRNPCRFEPVGAEDSLVFPMSNGPAEVAAVALVDPDNVFFTDRYSASVWKWAPRVLPTAVQVGRGGDGPGEYRMTGPLAVTADGKIQVTDHASRSVTIADGEGVFERRVKIPAGMGFHSAVGPFAGNRWVYSEVRAVNMRGREGRTTDSVDVFVWTEGGVAERIGTFAAGVQYWDLRERFDALQVPFSPSFYIARLGEEVVLAASESSTLTIVEPVTRTVRTVDVPYRGMRVTERMIEDDRERIAGNARNADLVRDLHRRAGVWADSTPAFSHLATDGESTIVLQHYTHPDSTKMTAVSADGELIGEWSVSGSLSLGSISRQRISFVQNVSDDASLLRVFARQCDGGTAMQ